MTKSERMRAIVARVANVNGTDRLGAVRWIARHIEAGRAPDGVDLDFAAAWVGRELAGEHGRRCQACDGEPVGTKDGDLACARHADRVFPAVNVAFRGLA